MILAIILAVIAALVLTGVGILALMRWITRRNVWVSNRPIG